MATNKASKPEPIEGEGWDTVEGEFGEIANPEQDGPAVGEYVGTRTVEVDDDKEDSGKRQQTIHDFDKLDTGDRFSIWGSTDLDSKLEKVEPGTVTMVTYLETEAIKGGRRQFKRFRVQTRA